MNSSQPNFRRSVIIVAAIHIFVIAAIVYFMQRPVKKSGGAVTWVDPASFGAPSASEEAAILASQEKLDQAKEVTVETPSEVSKTSIPEPTPEPTPEVSEVPPPEAPSEIALATPTPQASPRVTPQPTPKVTPKSTPKPTPKPTPKVTPKATPKPKLTPKPKPSPDKDAEEEDDDSPKVKATPHPSPKPSSSPVKKASSGTKSTSKSQQEKKSSHSTVENHSNKNEAKNSGEGRQSLKNAFLANKNGAGGSGASGTTGGSGGSGGADSGAIGAYHELIHDRFYGQWEQPTSIPTEHKHEFVCTLHLVIDHDGTISSFSLAKPSGNPVMDESVLAAAAKVKKIAPLPEGLGTSSYTVNINFELE